MFGKIKQRWDLISKLRIVNTNWKKGFNPTINDYLDLILQLNFRGIANKDELLDKLDQK